MCSIGDLELAKNAYCGHLAVAGRLGVEVPRVVFDVILHERRDEEIAVIVALFDWETEKESDFTLETPV